MKNFRFITILIISLLLNNLAISQSGGVRFQKGDWKDVLNQARLFKKLIFLDTYTTWCAPCKQMEREVFAKDQVGEKFNATFINYRVDAEKGEGAILAKKFGVSSYPTLLFVDAEENIVHKREGAMPLGDLMGEVDVVIASTKEGKPISIWEKEYTDGRRDPDFLYAFINKRTKFGSDNKLLLDEYFYTLHPKDWTVEKNLRLILNNPFEADSKAYDILCANRVAVENFLANGDSRIDKALGSAVYDSFQKVLKAKDSVKLEKILTKASSCMPNIADRMNSRYRMLFYQNMKDVPKFTKYATEYFDNYLMYQSIASIRQQDEWDYEVALYPFKTGAKDSTLRKTEYENFKRFYRNLNATRTADEFETVCKGFVEMVNDHAALESAMVWMQRSIELLETPENLNTYAKLLLKTGNKTKAIEFQERAIEIAKSSQQDAKTLQEELEKMRL